MAYIRENAFILLLGLCRLGFHSFFAAAVYNNCKAFKSRHRTLLCVLGFFFPVIIGFVLLFFQKDIERNRFYRKSIVCCLVAMLFFFGSFATAAYGTVRYLTAEESRPYFATDIVFYDENRQPYRFDFAKKGFDYLFDENGNSYDADLCYLDGDSVLFYDEQMTVTVGADGKCRTEDGSLCYPVKYVETDEDGNYQLDFTDKHPYYDSKGNGYVYDNVPYYDADGNKYYFTVASGDTLGSYTNLADGGVIAGENAYVDKNGCLVSLNTAALIKGEHGQYTDAGGKVYYKASAVQWDKHGKLNYIGLE